LRRKRERERNIQGQRQEMGRRESESRGWRGWEQKENGFQGERSRKNKYSGSNKSPASIKR